MNSKKLDKGVVHNSFDKYEIAVDNDADYYGESYNYASEDYMKNLNVYKHFEKCGFRDLLTGLHKNTLRQFWVYERDEYFNKCFEDWLSKKT